MIICSYHNLTDERNLNLRDRSLVASDLQSETKGSQFKSSFKLYAEVSCLNYLPG